MQLFKRNGYYQIQYFDENLQRIRRKSLKTKIKNEALLQLTDFKKSLLQAQTRPIITVYIFRDKYKKFIRENYSKKYCTSVDLSFRMLTKFLTKDINLSNLNNVMMEKFLIHIFGKSKYAAMLYLRTLKAAMNRAVSWGYIDKNPFKGIKLPKIPQKYPIFITENELDLIISRIKENDIRDIVTIAFYTGMRVSEILNLCWKAVDMSSGIITVQNSGTFTTKSKRERVIPIHEKIRHVLNSRLKKSKYIYVFSKCGILYQENYVSKKFKNAVRDVKLSDSLHFHSLRHSFASNLVKKGVSLYVIKELLGHESITTTEIYSHLQNESLINAISLL